LAYFLLGEKLTIYDVFSIITAFLGVIVINNPFGDDHSQ